MAPAAPAAVHAAAAASAAAAAHDPAFAAVEPGLVSVAVARSIRTRHDNCWKVAACSAAGKPRCAARRAPGRCRAATRPVCTPSAVPRFPDTPRRPRPLPWQLRRSLWQGSGRSAAIACRAPVVPDTGPRAQVPAPRFAPKLPNECGQGSFARTTKSEEGLPAGEIPIRPCRSFSPPRSTARCRLQQILRTPARPYRRPDCPRFRRS